MKKRTRIQILILGTGLLTALVLVAGQTGCSAIMQGASGLANGLAKDIDHARHAEP